MISALKITADRMADAGLRQLHHVERAELRIGRREGRRDDREVLGHVVGDAEGGQRAARHQQLLADLDDLDAAWSGWSRGRPCCRLPWPPACRCSSPRPRRPAPAPARRWCRRRSSRPAGPAAWYSRISVSLASGVASARKSSTPASAAMAAAVSALSPVIITVLMPMRRSSAKRSLMPPLTMSLSSTDAEHARAVGHDQRRAAAAGDVVDRAQRPRRGNAPPSASTCLRTASAAPLRIWRVPPDVDAAHAGLRGERHERRRAASRRSRSRRLNFCLASTTMLRPSGVSSASEASCAASASSCSRHARRGKEARRPGGCRA